MKTTIVKPKEFTASEITAYALKVLHLQGYEVWRQNNVRAIRGRTFTGKKGLSDIMGFQMTTGKLVAVEVKKTGDKLSDDQKEFLSKVSDAGAFAFLARQDGNQIVIEPWKM